MTSTEIITICISTIALIVSIVAIALQYGHRDNVQFKLTKTSLVSLEPQSERSRSFEVVMNISVFNMGTGAVVLDTISLNLDGEITARSDEEVKVNPVSIEAANIPIPPITPEDYGKLSFSPSVIPQKEIYTRELVFNLLHFGHEHKYLTAEGDLIFNATFYNSKGDLAKVSFPIGDIEIAGVRDEESKYTLEFNVSDSQLHKAEF